MITELSILMPCYNNECYGLVADICAQAESIIRSGRRLKYEVIVADDGSTDARAIAANRRIDSLPECTYELRRRNVGRAAIRNHLAQAASYEWLLFIDSDMKLRNGSFLKNYIDADSRGAIYGGYEIRGDANELKGNLRYRYEARYNRNSSAEERRKSPYSCFHVSNLAIRRSVMLAHPLDGRITRYGHEDLLFGKALARAGVEITHIDNPVSFEDFESNADFLAKTEESIEMLYALRGELDGYSSVISAARRIGKAHLKKAFTTAFAMAAKAIKNNLTGNNPSVLLFNIYKLGMFCSIEQGKTHDNKPHNCR